MRSIFRMIVLIAVGCVLFASTAAARGHHGGGGKPMGGMGSGDMGGMGMGGLLKMTVKAQ